MCTVAGLNDLREFLSRTFSTTKECTPFHFGEYLLVSCCTTARHKIMRRQTRSSNPRRIHTVHPAPKLNCQNFIVPVRGVGKQVRRRWRQEITSGRTRGRNPDSKKRGLSQKGEISTALYNRWNDRTRTVLLECSSSGSACRPPSLTALSSHQTIQP